MIHDATVEVTCDGDGCWEHRSVTLPFTYSSFTGHGGRYDASEKTVNRLLLEADSSWVLDGDQHYCPDCYEDLFGRLEATP